MSKRFFLPFANPARLKFKVVTSYGLPPLEEAMLKISVDFNSMSTDPEKRVMIPPVLYPELQTRLKIGEKAILYEEDDFEVQAFLEYDPAYRQWFGRPDWSSIRYYEND